MGRGDPRARARSSSQPAFAPFDAGETSPGPSVESDEEILDWVARDAETALHPSCTCRMGIGELAVVDPATMAVHGLDGLRVVDASVFPYVTNGNIYAPVMMVAEKAADLILGNTPLRRSTRSTSTATPPRTERSPPERASRRPVRPAAQCPAGLAARATAARPAGCADRDRLTGGAARVRGPVVEAVARVACDPQVRAGALRGKRRRAVPARALHRDGRG